MITYHVENSVKQKSIKEVKELWQTISIAQKKNETNIIDFNSLIGVSLKERYESILLKLIEYSRELEDVWGHDSDEDLGRNFWIHASPESTSIFEVMTMGFYPAPADTYNCAEKVYCGAMTPFLNYRWDLFKNPELKANILKIGYGKYYIELEILNYFI